MRIREVDVERVRRMAEKMGFGFRERVHTMHPETHIL